MIPTLNHIKPSKNGESDFFSWQLYRWLKRHPHKKTIWEGTWNSFTGFDGSGGTLYIGSERDQDGWISARPLRNLCGYGANLDSVAYSPRQGTRDWKDVSELFWDTYMQIGVCAIHGDYSHKWNTNGDSRSCEYCNKVEIRRIIMVPKEIWEPL